MMYYGPGMGGWGMALMIISNMIVLGLLIFISVLVARYIRPGRMSSTPAAEVTPEQILARRLARGEIDEDEYRRLLHALSSSTAESY
jgi:putative membrane protein